MVPHVTAAEATSATRTAPSSYADVLRNPRLAILLSGDAISSLGDGMTFVALPVMALRLRGDMPAAFAVSIVTTAPLVLPVILSFAFGLGSRRFRPWRVLLADCLVRGSMFTALGAAAMAGAVSIAELAVVLFVGSVLRTLSLSSRRLVATGMVGASGRLAVNGLLSTSEGIGSYVVGPALGGLLVALGHAPLILLIDGLTYVALLGAVAFAGTARRQATAESTPTNEDPTPTPAPRQRAIATESGWTILRRFPSVATLLAVTFLFNLFYGPVEVAVPVFVTSSLHAHSAAIGVLWTGFGFGAVIGAACTNLLRRVPHVPLLLAIIGGWGASMLMLAVAPSVAVATIALGIGGLIYGPYTALAYTILQDALDADDQQPVLTIWTAASTVALPLGLAVGGPLVAGVGPRGGLVASAVVTALLVPVGARWLRSRR
jgi:MFS family permease